MNEQKMLDVMAEINAQTAEREELVECIALALLAKKNLFILGDTGQAKSYCINEWRKRITGAKQFERLMSKQTDEEALFGRIDLASLIPGCLPQAELLQDSSYAILYKKLSDTYEQYAISGKQDTLEEAKALNEQLEAVKKIVCSLHSNVPTMITQGKIPDSHIVFLDEIFKAGDGILNSLLTAMNEHVYTNEGKTVKIPVISFFSASNEIPDFKDSAQSLLKPLYDRFDLKVMTGYVAEKANRLSILSQKQDTVPKKITATITLEELRTMQREAEGISVSETIHELMDNVLCELRRKGVHVSDRKFFGYMPIVRAKAYLSGRREVVSKDLTVLKNYFWNSPSEIETVSNVLSEICENPVGAEIDRLLEMAAESMNEMRTALADDSTNLKPYIKFSKELYRIYKSVSALQKQGMSGTDMKEVSRGTVQLETYAEEADKLAQTPHITLAEKKRLDV